MDLDELARLASQGRLTRRHALLLGGGAILLAGCGGKSGGSATTNQGVSNLSTTAAAGGGKDVAEVTWGIVGDAVGLDPLVAYDYQSVQPMYQAFDTILQLNTRNEIIPMIATAWKEQDPTTYVYDIRTGVTFQDGSPMTAADVAYSLNRHLDPKNGSFLAPFMASVKSIESTGNQVIVHLKTPDANWKYVPCIPVGQVVSQKNIEALLAAGKKPGTPSALPIGTGPYKLVSWDKGNAIKLTRYDGYWDTSRAHKVKDLTFQVVTDAETLASGLLNGDIQGTFQLNGRAVQPLKTQLQVLRSQSVNIRLLGFNCKKKPFDDKRVRQALSLAIDKQGLLASAYGGEGTLWNSTPIEQNQWVFSKSVFADAYAQLPDYTKQDLAKAGALIKAAGAEGATGNIVAATPEQQAQALAVQAAGASIGLKLTIDKVPSEQQVAVMFTDKPRTYSLTMYDWGSDTPDPASNVGVPFLKSNVVTNFNQYDNPALDKLINQQIQMPDGDERAKLLTQIQATLVDDQPWAVLYWINNLTVLSKQLGGLRLVPQWAYWSWAADLSGS
jgi:peptide/nickel transport system substrate-binding protein